MVARVQIHFIPLMDLLNCPLQEDDVGEVAHAAIGRLLNAKKASSGQC